MDYIEQNGIAVQYPKSLNQMARELAVEANRIKDNPQYVVAVGYRAYAIRVGESAIMSYELDDMVP
jgi:hypothetical protein